MTACDGASGGARYFGARYASGINSLFCGHAVDARSTDAINIATRMISPGWCVAACHIRIDRTRRAISWGSRRTHLPASAIAYRVLILAAVIAEHCSVFQDRLQRNNTASAV